MSLTDPVRAFHDKHNLPTADSPRLLTAEQLLMRVRLMQEEFNEMVVALARATLEQSADYMVEALDGMADTIYTIAGTAVASGLPLDAAYAEVCRSNLTKTPLNEGGKGGKGPGYEAPRLAALLLAAAPSFVGLPNLADDPEHAAVVARNPLRRLVLRTCDDCRRNWTAPSETGACPTCHGSRVRTLGENHTNAARI